MSLASDIIIAAYDHRLLQGIRTGLMPHFTDAEAKLHTEVTVPCREGIRSEQHRLCNNIRFAKLLVVGFTGLVDNEQWAFESAHRTGRGCGLILVTENRPLIASVSVVHLLRPFRFVVSFGSVRRDKQIKELFPGIPYLWDISSFDEPGGQIAAFIRQHGP